MVWYDMAWIRTAQGDHFRFVKEFRTAYLRWTEHPFFITINRGAIFYLRHL